MPSKAKTGKKLVIVESPAKSKTIAKYLGEGFIVEASIGHIRDLPQPSELPADLKKTSLGKFAVDVENDFKPYYVVSPDKKKKVAELKAQLKDADALYLATDGDREGEAIAWHLLEVLKPKVPVYRMTFGEITKEAIHRAMDNLRDVDAALVDAQETRRILDRLYGYEISPVLWRKVARGLSAGRVQSVVTRMVVDRERERMAFRSASYWDLTGQFGADAGSFKAKLAAVDGAKVATGRDFNDDGELTSRNVAHLNEELATSLAAALQDADFRVRSVDTKPYTRRPAAPFTTSTLQQEAGRKLRFSSKSTMQIAQRLYENGYITYMRTDSSALSDEAVTAARRQAAELYGPEYVPQSPRVYTSKAANAQEAHEAIRPAGDSFRTPAQVAKQLSGDEFRLYELIWKRTVASQMGDAKGSTATIRLGAVATDGRDAEFSASGTVITFPGFLAAYEEGKDESRGDDDSDEARRLPNVAKGDGLTASEIIAVGHETSPPPRYTEASLTAELEKKGIGRPSTYASTISTIQDRGYVRKQGSALVPSWIAFSVVRLLEQHFTDYVDYEFTADMEGDLDKIANGQAVGAAWLKHFYYGEDADPGLLSIVNNLGEIDAREINSVPIADGITLRVGKFGPYLESSLPTVDPKTGEVVESARANVPEDLAPDELTAAEGSGAHGNGRSGGTGPGSRSPHRPHGRRQERQVWRLRHRDHPGDDRGTAGQPARGVLQERQAQAAEEARQGQAAHRLAVQVHDRGRGHPRRGAAAHEPSPGARRGRRGQPDHGAERPLRPVPEEGHGLTVHRLGRGNLHHHAGAGAGDLLPAQAARCPRGRAAAGRVRSGPGVGEEHRGEGGPLRSLHHRRHHQHHRAPRHVAGGTDPGTRRRTPRRKAGQGPGQAHHHAQGPGEEGRSEEVE